jgi:hypothetical protein
MVPENMDMPSSDLMDMSKNCPLNMSKNCPLNIVSIFIAQQDEKKNLSISPVTW